MDIEGQEKVICNVAVWTMRVALINLYSQYNT